MSKKRIWVVVGVLVVLGLLIGGFGCKAPAPTPTPVTPTPTPAPSPAEPEVIKWRGQDAYYLFPEYRDRFPFGFLGEGGGGEVFLDRIEKLSGGRLQIEMSPPGSIVPVPEMMHAVREGVLDCTGLYSGIYFVGEVPEANFELGMPFGWETAEHMWDALWNLGMYDILYEAYAEQNLFPMIYPMGDLYHIGSTFPIDSPDAIKGKRIRAGAAMAKYIENLGGSPVLLPWSEMYMALKLGTIDGYLASPWALETVKLKEVIDYYVNDPTTSPIGVNLLINMESLNALPEDLRTLIVEEWKYWMAGWALQNHSASRYMTWKVEQEGYTKRVFWSDEEKTKAYKAGIAAWDFYAMTPRCEKMLEIMKSQARQLGIME